MDGDSFEALADSDRRRLLVALAERSETDNPIRVPEDLVAADADTDEAHVRYYHTHLPKLEQMGFVDWNDDRQTVGRGPRFDELAPLVAAVTTDARAPTD